MVEQIEQGMILKIEGISHLVLVVSNDTINQTGRVVVCPVYVPEVTPTLSVPLENGMSVVCDTIRQLDLAVRRYAHREKVSLAKMIQITDRVQSMFDYY